MEFKWEKRYSLDEKTDKQGRWARVLWINGIQIGWVNKSGDYFIGEDQFPTGGTDIPRYIDIDANIDKIKKNMIKRFKTFIKKVTNENTSN